MWMTSDFGSKILSVVCILRSLNKYLDSYFYFTVQHSDIQKIFLWGKMNMNISIVLNAKRSKHGHKI